MSRVSLQWTPKTQSDQRDDGLKEADNLKRLMERLEALAQAQETQQGERIEKYSCIGVTEEDIGSAGHTPQKYRDAYQDFTDLYGQLFDDISITGTNEDEYEKHDSDADIDLDCSGVPVYDKSKLDDNESIASDSTTASEKYNMFNIPERVLRMATGFPSWVPNYGKKKERVYGSNSSVSSVSPPAQVKEKETDSDSVKSVTFSSPPDAQQMEFESNSIESISPPANYMEADSDSVESVSPPASVKQMDVDSGSDSGEPEVIYQSIEVDDYESEPPTVQQERDSDETLSDPNREDDSDSISATSYDSPRRTNKAVNHQFFYLHHRMTKRAAPAYITNGDAKRPKIETPSPQ
ncbi:hypothetical protein FQN49_000597 [Arthroderma sp. PD_2]|nr:hypothetical protein FQN49_000597 [Arthroderma sp. PD_2]